MNIAIFGGSFDPPHAGHDEIVKTALNALDIDKLIIIPAFCSPFKSEFCASPKLRLAWCKALWEQNSRILVSDFEISKEQKMPTITSVKHFKEIFEPEKIYLIIGADCLESLKSWSEYESLEKLVNFVVATRENSRIPNCYKSLKNLQINVNISSSFIRENFDFSGIPAKIRDEVREVYERKN